MLRATPHAIVGVLAVAGLVGACAAPPAPPGPPATTKPGEITGTGPAGQPFGTLAAALLLGAPDDPTATTVVDLFSANVGCATLASTGWDATLATGTQILELKLFGTTAPSTFTVTQSHTPAPGEASVNHTLVGAAGPTETSASGATVSLTALTAQGADGTFDLRFATDALTGSFHAVFCAGGHEP